MLQSKANNLNLRDILNTIKHMVFVLVSGSLASVIQGYSSGNGLDIEALKTGAIISLLTGLQVLCNRYLADNSK